MNTLSRAITARFFAEPENYDALKTGWQSLQNSPQRHELEAAHHLLYLILRGKDWRKAFTPITRVSKLENGAFSNWGLFNALYALHSKQSQADLLAPFAGLVTPEMLQVARQLVLPVNASAYQPQDFIPGSFPFEAYKNIVPAQANVAQGQPNA